MGGYQLATYTSLVWHLHTSSETLQHGHSVATACSTPQLLPSESSRLHFQPLSKRQLTSSTTLHSRHWQEGVIPGWHEVRVWSYRYRQRYGTGFIIRLFFHPEGTGGREAWLQCVTWGPRITGQIESHKEVMGGYQRATYTLLVWHLHNFPYYSWDFPDVSCISHFSFCLIKSLSSLFLS